MGELRKDYILDRWVLIASERSKRPHQFKKDVEGKPPEKDFFAPGNENMTPAAIEEVKDNDHWKMRVFHNKFAAVKMEGQSEIKTDNDFFTYSANYGEHEVLVETPDSMRQIWDFSDDEIVEVLEMYNRRIEAVRKMDGINYVCLFKNHGKDGGTSIFHSHSQLVALNHVPKIVRDEIDACASYDTCPYCKIIDIERKGSRLCFENQDYVAFTPYASRFPFEVWIFPKVHVGSLDELGDKKGLAEIMGKVLRKLKELNASFNYLFHYAPNGNDLHFHIEVIPRLSTWAGFEFNGTIINTEAPEEAAMFYRGEE